MEEVDDEPLFCERAAGIDIGKAVIMVTIRVPGDTPGGPAAAGDPGVPGRPQGPAGPGGLAALLAGDQDRHGSDIGLLETGVLPAGAGGVRLRAVSRLPGQGAARTAEDRQAGLGLASEDHRARQPAGQLRAPRGHPAAAHPYPLPQAPGPGPRSRDGPVREAARRRAPEAVQRDQQHPRGLRTGDADRDHRRPAQPQSPGADGPDPDARQDHPAGRSPGLLLLHRGARLHPGDDAGEHRPPQRPDQRAVREDRGAVRAVRAADRPAGRRPRHRGHHRPGHHRRVG